MSTFQELLAQLPANDNGRRLVALAGYDDARIPAAQMQAALHVIWCLEKGIFSRREIARFVGDARLDVHALVRVVRSAATASHSVREARGRHGARKPQESRT